jgi:hypothetical protein
VALPCDPSWITGHPPLADKRGLGDSLATRTASRFGRIVPYSETVQKQDDGSFPSAPLLRWNRWWASRVLIPPVLQIGVR